MQNMPDYSDILRMAQTPEGKKLIAMLRNCDSASLSAALSSAKAGDYSAARNALSGILGSPEAQELLKNFGGDYGGNGR